MPKKVTLSMDLLLWLDHFRETLPDRVEIEDSGCWRWATAGIKKPRARYVKQSMQVAGNNYSGPRLVAAAFIDSSILAKKIHEANACHTCDNSWCMNPAHLFIGTQKENMADMWRKGRGRKMTKHYK